MTNQKEKRKVPELRFPEFSGEIQIDIINNYFENIRNGFVGTATPYYTDNKGIMYLQSNNIKNGKINDNNLIYVDREFHELHIKNQLKLNDLLMVQSGHAGDCAVVSQKYVNANCHALIIMTPNNKIDTKYLSYYLQSNKGKKKLNHYITGNTIKHILASEIKKLSFPVVSLKEQKKIGEFFSKLDRQIELEEKKLALLEEQKKGYMQKIFSQELRFKDENGEEYPEWEEFILKDYVNYSNGKALENEIDELGKYELINLNSISDKGKLKSSNKMTNSNTNLLEKDDLVIVLSDIAKGNLIGMTAIIPEDNKYVLNQRIGQLKLKDINKVKANYLTYYLNFKRNYFIKMSAGMSQININKDAVLNFSGTMPCYKEQIKIDLFLSSFENEMKYLELKIKVLKARKINLLNKLLL
ncbi:restriction endonuclease subunit S [Macrococcus armenti]|uniref:Restriction endonuclease subunit S n=1 Tax=Macrococcus armenti TaxID=2875764 RepID=A0ABY3ZVH1_9STAP|nr:restriction endonuclease subunit S [Macrococcus armenti]UOB20898.1 restriction endonuclease subunit S [Macrococcus armenti]